MTKEINRRQMSVVRHQRIRSRVTGSTDRPRLAVFRSAKHIYAQVIDDTKGHTLVTASTLRSTTLRHLARVRI